MRGGDMKEICISEKKEAEKPTQIHRLKIVNVRGMTYYTPQRWDNGNWWDYVYDPVNDPASVCFLIKEDAMAYLMNKKAVEEMYRGEDTEVQYIYI